MKNLMALCLLVVAMLFGAGCKNAGPELNVTEPAPATILPDAAGDYRIAWRMQFDDPGNDKVTEFRVTIRLAAQTEQRIIASKTQGTAGEGDFLVVLDNAPEGPVEIEVVAVDDEGALGEPIRFTVTLAK